MSDRLLTWRREFPITESCTYLISNSLGAMPRAARTRVNEYLDAWDQLGVRAWAERRARRPPRRGAAHPRPGRPARPWL